MESQSSSSSSEDKFTKSSQGSLTSSSLISSEMKILHGEKEEKREENVKDAKFDSEWWKRHKRLAEDEFNKYIYTPVGWLRNENFKLGGFDESPHGSLQGGPSDVSAAMFKKNYVPPKEVKVVKEAPSSCAPSDHATEHQDNISEKKKKKKKIFVAKTKEEPKVKPDEKIYRNINTIFNFKGRIKNGTYTTVNRYYSAIHNRDIAIKIIPKIGIPDLRRCKYVPLEVELADDEEFEHPNIVRYLEVYEITLRAYIMMEYAERGNLTDYVESKGRLDPLTYQKLFRQLLNAVDYCHTYGICHRKLSTDNCLLTKNMNLKLCDFSFSGILSDYDDKLKTFCGVPGFTAPEIMMCRKYQPCKTEAWSCGVILYVMIYASMPFSSAPYSKLIREVLRPIKFHWYCDTPIDAVTIMHRTIAPVKRRWGIKKVLGLRWVTPKPEDGYNYYVEWYKKETAGPSLPELRNRLIDLKDLIYRDYTIPHNKKYDVEEVEDEDDDLLLFPHSIILD